MTSVNYHYVPSVENKYDLVPVDIFNIVVINRKKLSSFFEYDPENGVWVKYETTKKTKFDEELGTYNEFVLKLNETKTVYFKCLSHGGSSEYNFPFFYKNINCKADVEIQEKLLNLLNKLVDAGAIIITKQSKGANDDSNKTCRKSNKRKVWIRKEDRSKNGRKSL